MPAVRAQPPQLSRMQGLCALGKTSDQYRRRARRLRHTLRDHPTRLHRSLARLAAEIDHAPASETKSSILPTSIPARRFEILVREAMAKGMMRYSQRLALFKAAAALGLGRFEANLILAIEQNRQVPSNIDWSTHNRDAWLTILLVGLFQSLILLAVWWIAVR
jgi:hypothetical protein